MKKLIIFGIGDLAQLAHYYFNIDSKYEPIAFTLNEEYISESIFENKPILPFETIEKKYPPAEYSMFIAIGYSEMNKNREAKYLQAKAKGYQLATYISSKCTYLSQSQPGDNTFIFEDNTIQPFVKIGANNIIWSGGHIGHHSIIHNHVFIAPHVAVAGRCEILSNCFLGINSTLQNNVTLKEKTLVGAGAMISSDSVLNGVYLPVKSNLISKKSDKIKLK